MAANKPKLSTKTQLISAEKVPEPVIPIHSVELYFMTHIHKGPPSELREAFFKVSYKDLKIYKKIVTGHIKEFRKSLIKFNKSVSKEERRIFEEKVEKTKEEQFKQISWYFSKSGDTTNELQPPSETSSIAAKVPEPVIPIFKVELYFEEHIYEGPLNKLSEAFDNLTLKKRAKYQKIVNKNIKEFEKSLKKYYSSVDQEEEDNFRRKVQKAKKEQTDQIHWYSAKPSLETEFDNSKIAFAPKSRKDKLKRKFGSSSVAEISKLESDENRNAEDEIQIDDSETVSFKKFKKASDGENTCTNELKASLMTTVPEPVIPILRVELYFMTHVHKGPPSELREAFDNLSIEERVRYLKIVNKNIKEFEKSILKYISSVDQEEQEKFKRKVRKVLNEQDDQLGWYDDSFDSENSSEDSD